MSLKRFSGIALLVLSLASCFFPRINSGRITQMEHQPERVYQVDEGYDLTIRGGKDFPDTTIHFSDYVKKLDDEDWIIKFENQSESRLGEKVYTETQSRIIYATEKFYNQFQVGDNIDLSNYVENPIPFEDSDYDYKIN